MILYIFNAWKQTIVVKITFVVIFQIYVVMTTFCLFFRTIYLWFIKTYIFWSGSSKKATFWKFDHFSHSLWSTNSGHEHEKGGHMNPIVLYCTIDLCHIKIYIFLGRKLKKSNFFFNLDTFHTPCGHHIVVMSTKRWSHESWFFITL